MALTFATYYRFLILFLYKANPPITAKAVPNRMMLSGSGTGEGPAKPQNAGVAILNKTVMKQREFFIKRHLLSARTLRKIHLAVWNKG
jgi:hypothetical protein